MRTLQQPGPVHPDRLDRHWADARDVRLTLPAGASLTEALAAPLMAAGLQSATIVLRDAALAPFRFVMPGPPDGPEHVAYFTPPVSPAGIVRIEQANATFGWSHGRPLIHCHAAWTEADGTRRGGHVLPQETIVAAPAEAVAWGFTGIRMEAAFDPETRFTLLQPRGGSSGGSLFMRIRPNTDLLTAMESAGLRNATVRGSLGSLVGATFTDGRRIEDIATEVLVRRAFVRDGVAAAELLVVDMRGQVHQGWLTRGENAVCITFDLVMTADRAIAGVDGSDAPIPR